MSEKSDTTPEHDVQILAGEYVLGTLSPERRAEVLERMDHDPALLRAIQSWQARLLPLPDVAEPQTPGARLRSLLGRQPGGSANGARARSKKSRRWNSLSLWRRLAAVGLVASVLLGTQLLTRVMPSSTPSWLAVLSSPEDKTPGWVIQISDSREIQLIALGMPKVPDDKTLQLWTETDDSRGLVSLGRVRPYEVLKARFNALLPLKANQVFELTLENATGPIASKPGGAVQFIGRVAKVM